MLSGPADAGPDRLVGACQAAISVHAGEIALEFVEGTRLDAEVQLRFTFDNGHRTHDGSARCLFHRAPSRTAPPSLVGLEVTGGVTPGRFLQSHHAVWKFFRGEPEPVAGAGSQDSEPPAERIRQRPPRPPRPRFVAVD